MPPHEVLKLNKRPGGSFNQIQYDISQVSLTLPGLCIGIKCLRKICTIFVTLRKNCTTFSLTPGLKHHTSLFQSDSSSQQNSWSLPYALFQFFDVLIFSVCRSIDCRTSVSFNSRYMMPDGSLNVSAGHI